MFFPALAFADLIYVGSSQSVLAILGQRSAFNNVTILTQECAQVFSTVRQPPPANCSVDAISREVTRYGSREGFVWIMREVDGRVTRQLFSSRFGRAGVDGLFTDAIADCRNGAYI